APTQISVLELYQKNLILLEPQLNNKHITLQIDAAPELSVYADYNMIDTVIRNVLGNSVKFTEYNGSITLSAKENEGEIQLCISDNGVGMTPEQMQRLFSLDKSNVSSGTAGEKG